METESQESGLVLRWTQNGQTEQFSLTAGDYTIGRDPDCDLTIEESSISRHHARLFSADNIYHLEDLGSSNGTKVNGQMLEPHQSFALAPGDQIFLGRLPVRLQDISEAPDDVRGDTTQTLVINFSSLKWTQEIEGIRNRLYHLFESSVDDAEKLGVLKSGLDDEVKELTHYVESKFREHEVLQQINQEIGQILDANQLLSTALKMVVKVLGADRGFILLYDPRHGVLKSMVTHRFDRADQSALDFDFTFSQTIAKSCFERQQIDFIDDALKDPRFKSSQSIMASRIRSVVCIPLKQEEKISGVIYLDNLRTPGAFHRHQTEFLNAFSCQTAIALENARLYTQAVTDDLSRLYNRKYADKRIYEEMGRSSRYTRACSMILLDVDFFKKVNDTYGHLAGDQVLVGVSNVIRESTRATDIAARYGGEEFLILLPETELDGCRQFAERLRQSIESMVVEKDNLSINVTISAGLATYQPWMQNNVSAFVDQADKALYFAKENGRNQVQAADDLDLADSP